MNPTGGGATLGPKPNKKIVETLLRSKDCMQVVTEFLVIKNLLELQRVNKEFYNRIIPVIMNERKMFPNIDPKMHLFLHNQCLWGIRMSNKSTTREIDFEEDEWIHDNQHVIDENSMQWPEKLFDFNEIGKGETDPELKINQKEDVLIQYTFQLSKDKFLVFPVYDSAQIKRGLFIELGDKSKKEKPKVKKTAPPPRELIRPGMLP